MRKRMRVWQTALHHCPCKKALRCCHISTFAQWKVDRMALFLHRTIEVGPLSSALDICLIATPGGPDWPCLSLPLFLKLGHIVLHPPHDGGVRHVESSFGPHHFQIPVAQFIHKLSSHAQV